MIVLVEDLLLEQTVAHDDSCPVVALARGLGWIIAPVPVNAEILAHFVCVIP